MYMTRVFSSSSMDHGLPPPLPPLEAPLTASHRIRISDSSIATMGSFNIHDNNSSIRLKLKSFIFCTYFYFIFLFIIFQFFFFCRDSAHPNLDHYRQSESQKSISIAPTIPMTITVTANFCFQKVYSFFHQKVQLVPCNYVFKSKLYFGMATIQALVRARLWFLELAAANPQEILRTALHYGFKLKQKRAMGRFIIYFILV